ncbi:MAG: enoyl-CoA hydratase/isomerase family protein [candidate division Zixibacteria bacterium]
MKYVEITESENIATVILKRGKVNAFNEDTVDEMQSVFNDLESKSDIKSVIFTGHGKFFSFGFDVPELIQLSREDFKRFLTKFTALYNTIYTFPKPVIAALNGHAVAGGCMLAIMCDYRIIILDRAKVSLNEIAIGVPVFAGSADVLIGLVGQRNAETILLTGDMYDPPQAMSLGMVDKIVSPDILMQEAHQKALELGNKRAPAYSTIKNFIRRPISEKYLPLESEYIEKFLDIWNSQESQNLLKDVVIR